MRSDNKGMNCKGLKPLEWDANLSTSMGEALWGLGRSWSPLVSTCSEPCYSFTTVLFKASSLYCSSAIGLGASIIISRPWLFFGNAMKSRIEFTPFITAHRRSNPKAIPPCGGAPYSNAPNRNPNCASASSLENPSRSKFLDWSALSWILIDPPPISTPLITRS